MMLDEIINTCMNDKVAEAAIASIGVGFRDNVRRLADARDMEAGVFVASLVRKFSWRADEMEKRALYVAMDGAQAPILAGLRYIVETIINEERRRDMSAVAARRRSGEASRIEAAA